MTNASLLHANNPVRMLLMGYPGTAKTGSLASLLNAGFKMRFMDFDGNLEPLFQHTRPEMLANLDVLTFEDKVAIRTDFSEPVGIPKAFSNAFHAMDEWKYEQDGKEVSLGRSEEWGPDTVLVLDSLTKMGDAAMRRAMKIMNKTARTTTDGVWRLAMNEQLAFVEKLTSTSNRFHVIVLAHTKMIAPKDVRQGDSEIAQKVKAEIADMLPTRLYPNALGYQLPQYIGGEFPTIVEAQRHTKAHKTTYTLNLQPSDILDLKYPGSWEKLGEERLDVKDGMLRIFRALSPASVALVESQQAKETT